MNSQVTQDRHKIFTQWVNQYGDALYSWAIHKTNDESIAQDLVQETFAGAYQNLDGFNKTSSPETWLFGILRNKIVDHYRQSAKANTSSLHALDDTSLWFDEDDRWKKEYRPEPWEGSEVSLLDDPEFDSIFTHCVDELPVSWSTCIRLKYLGEKQTEEICQELEITATNLWQILHRAKLHLRNCLERNWFKA